MLLFPNAKINLGLHIVEKRPTDGYHNLETVFYPTPLTDALEITPLSECPTEKYVFHQSGIPIEGEAQHNLVVKAYKLLDEEFDLPPVEIHLFKRIPSGAGLGGGSSDAAFMLKGLNDLFGLEMSAEALENRAVRLGADCPFFIRNQATFAEGIGDVFSPISLSLKGYQLLLVKPDVFVSTKEAFALVKPHKPEVSLKEVVQTPVERWKAQMVNDFEASVFTQFPAVAEIKSLLYRHGALYVSMSGSGSSVFGLFAPDAVIPPIDVDARTFVYKGVLE